MSMSTGIFSAILLLYIIELKESLTERFIFKKAQGVYIRKHIYEVDHTAIKDTKYKLLQAYEGRGDINQIQLRYVGERLYTIKAFYDLGEVEGQIQFDSTNQLRASGTYQYVSGGNSDIGTYEFFLNKPEPSSIFVYYRNVVPNGLAEGYEVWIWSGKLKSEKWLRS